MIEINNLDRLIELNLMSLLFGFVSEGFEFKKRLLVEYNLNGMSKNLMDSHYSIVYVYDYGENDYV